MSRVTKAIAEMAARLAYLEDEVDMLQARVSELEAEGIAREESEAEDGGSEDSSSGLSHRATDDEVSETLSASDSSSEIAVAASADTQSTNAKRKRTDSKTEAFKKRN